MIVTNGSTIKAKQRYNLNYFVYWANSNDWTYDQTNSHT